jgi:hypothetical protein
MSWSKDEPPDGIRIVEGLYGSDCDRTMDGRQVNAQRVDFERAFMICIVRGRLKIERKAIALSALPLAR